MDGQRARSVSASVFPKTLAFLQRAAEILGPQASRYYRNAYYPSLHYPRSAWWSVYESVGKPASALWEWTLTQGGILPSATRSTGTKRPACRIGLTQRR